MFFNYTMSKSKNELSIHENTFKFDNLFAGHLGNKLSTNTLRIQCWLLFLEMGASGSKCTVNDLWSFDAKFQY